MRYLTMLAAMMLATCATPATQPRDAAKPSRAGEQVTSNETPDADNKPRAKLVCRSERKLGTHIPHQVCRWEKDIELDRALIQRAWQTKPRLQPSDK